MREVVQFILETSRILTDRASRNPRRTHDLGAGDPAVVIDGVVAHHLKVLRVVLRGCVRVGLVEGVHEAGTFDRLLRDAVHHVRRRYAGCFQDGRYDVDHVGELVTDAALVGNVTRPRNRHSLAYAAEMRGNLLGPRERRVERPGPGHRHVGIRHVRSPHIIEILQLVLHRYHDLIEHGDLVGRADEGTFGTVAVVAVDINDQGVVELALFLDFVDHTPNFVVGISDIGGEDVDL